MVIRNSTTSLWPSKAGECMIVKSIKQEWPILTIRLVSASACHRRGHMVRIGRIPKKLQSFFKPIHQHFGRRPWEHFWALVMAITISHGVTIDKLTKVLRGSTHRTDQGEFLWRSVWNESSVMQQSAISIAGARRKTSASSTRASPRAFSTIRRSNPA